MNIPITQSREWQKLQNDLKETSFFEKTESYQYLAILKHTPVGNYLYLPYGPVAENEKAFKQALKSLNELAKSKNAIFIRIEPQDPNQAKLLPKNTKKSKDLNPKDTWVLDLTAAKEDILHNFSQGTRTRYNTFAKKGLKVLKSTDPGDIHQLVSLQQKLAREKHIHAYPEDYLKAELAQPFATLYTVVFDGETAENLPNKGDILAASLFFDFQDTRYYMQSAADSTFKKLPATVALLATAIFDAKEKGMKNFDFWGIAPDGASTDHPWYGFTEFKKSFGGNEVHYAGTYDIVLRPSKYQIYQSLRKLNRFFRV